MINPSRTKATQQTIPQDVAPAPARRSAYPGRRASWRRWRCRRRCSPDRYTPPRRPPGRSWWRDFRARRRRRSQRPPPAGRHGSRWSPAVGCRATRGTSSRRCCRRPSRSSGSCRRWGDALKQASTATCTNTLTALQRTFHMYGACARQMSIWLRNSLIWEMELIKWVHIFDMQNIMCIIQELCVAWCKHIDGVFSSLLSLFFFSFVLFEFVLYAMVWSCANKDYYYCYYYYYYYYYIDHRPNAWSTGNLSIAYWHNRTYHLTLVYWYAVYYASSIRPQAVSLKAWNHQLLHLLSKLIRLFCSHFRARVKHVFKTFFVKIKIDIKFINKSNKRAKWIPSYASPTPVTVMNADTSWLPNWFLTVHVYIASSSRRIPANRHRYEHLKLALSVRPSAELGLTPIHRQWSNRIIYKSSVWILFSDCTLWRICFPM